MLNQRRAPPLPHAAASSVPPTQPPALPGAVAPPSPAHASPAQAFARTAAREREHRAVLIRPYRAADLESLILQPAQSHLQHLLLGRGYAQTLEACEAWTFVLRAQGAAGKDATEKDQTEKDQTEKVLACMGVHAIHPGRALAWSLIAGDIGRHFQAIHRAARRYLRVTPYARLEAHVDAGFTAGARWLKLLGFTCETPQGMRGFTAEGRTCHLYARVRAQAPTSTLR